MGNLFNFVVMIVVVVVLGIVFFVVFMVMSYIKLVVVFGLLCLVLGI